MIAAERGHISPVQWRWRIRLVIDRTMAGAVVAIGIVGRRRRIVLHYVFTNQQRVAQPIRNRRKPFRLLVRDSKKQTVAPAYF